MGDEVTGSGWDMLYVTCPRDSQEDGWEVAGCAGPGKGSGQETWPWESAAWRWDLKPGKQMTLMGLPRDSRWRKEGRREEGREGVGEGGEARGSRREGGKDRAGCRLKGRAEEEVSAEDTAPDDRQKRQQRREGDQASAPRKEAGSGAQGC